jgi:AcrR family transcriptional regulator
MTEKLDRRVQRTHQLLRDALIALSLERGYDAVTIQDITDYANLGRATFYLHFRDKEDLLLSTLQRIVDDLLGRIEPTLEGLFDHGDITPLLILFRHAEENADLYRIILRGRGASSVERRLREYASEQARQALEGVLGDQPRRVPLAITSNHFSRALLGMVDWWLENGLPYPAEYMARIFYELTVVGILKTQGIPVPNLGDLPLAPDTPAAASQRG